MGIRIQPREIDVPEDGPFKNDLLGRKEPAEVLTLLQDMAGTLSEAHVNRPLIVVIDELDRCRPSYAVELLEVAKHLFSVENIVFVLAVNRSELGHSIKALYGDGFDAEGYLRRFFDVDFQLPEPERDAFIAAMLDAIQINDYFIRTKDRSAVAHDSTVRAWLLGFFGAPDLSLRRVAQAIHRLGLVFASLRSDRISLASATVVALIVRTIDSDLYHRFVRGEVSDLDVSDMVFDRPGGRALQEKYGDYFEMILIRSRMEITSSSSSELWQKYKGIVDAEESDRVSGDLDQDYANQVIELLRNSSLTGVGFKAAAQRLELLSPDLIEEHTGAASNDS